MYKISPSLIDYIDQAFSLDVSTTECMNLITTRFSSNSLGITYRHHLNENVFIQDLMVNESTVQILFICVHSSLPRIHEYLQAISPSHFGQRYLMDDTLGNFQRVFDMNCLDPIPAKHLIEWKKGEICDAELIEMMIWNQEHVSDVDLYIMKSFNTTPIEINRRDYVGVRVYVEQGSIHCFTRELYIQKSSG